MSPEVFHGGKFTKEADIWSLGIVMLELCTGKRITQLTKEKN
jgi:serine/threonine protein kinase